MTADDPIPDAVLEAYRLEHASWRPIASGWINRTLLVRRGEERLILQRLHPVFDASVNRDIDAITEHLASRGVPTPRLVRTRDDALWVEHRGESERAAPWRMLTFVDGETLTALPSPAHARAAGAFVAGFHRALSDLDHEFAFVRPGAHDVDAHLARLRRLRSGGAAFDERSEADAVSDAILAAADALPELDRGPRRIVHGDLKVTNLLFGEGPRVTAIVDLDTLAHGSIAIDLGDALRSWCNRSDEASADARVDRDLFGAALAGYLEAAGDWLTPDERAGVVPALETICVELAARFASDLYEDAYFGYDPTRFASRRAHNLARAHAQLSLGLDVRRHRAELSRLASGA